MRARHGVYWYDLQPASIKIHRHGQDENWDYVRVILWKLDYAGTSSMDFSSDQTGIYWSNLTDSKVQIERLSDDSQWEQVRVKIWKIPEP